MTRQTRAALAAILIFAGAAAILFAMNRPPICTCGEIALWGPVGPTQSQMLADWYSFSHVVHGLIFYALLWLVARRTPVEWRFLLAMLVESSWEILENTPMVIDRYRTATAALGYAGDSIINSLSDIAMMAIGFLAARKLPLWGAILLFIALELIPLVVIRDNLFLNIWMLLAPNDELRTWQSAAALAAWHLAGR
ncbi:DUF2585 domain-containing protein [Sphingomonas sp. RG327]|jgi:hypothetical protein|uniref:DUF2585 domain-containing protein n=1 Tax=Sphingomonas anseongensis TaxID=2908207 RepID=A0ABT0RH07_9SPHN|nr:DUF2585 family protein [Sphingomonas anseongensis]MCL6679560.1 DUF2585 domain-containing protein [Sphingomonas anseongensis]